MAFVCVQKNWNMSGAVTSYHILDTKTKVLQGYHPDMLLNAMRDGVLQISNLELSPDGRVVEKDAAPKFTRMTSTGASKGRNRTPSEFVFADTSRKQ